MKKSTIFKIALSLVFAAILITDALSQAAAPFTDMKTVTTRDSVTTGVNVPYFVMPDPVLNSAFTNPYNTGATDAAQGINSEFSWTTGVNNDTTGDVTWTFGDSAAYIQLVWDATVGSDPSAAIDTLFVTEISANGCAANNADTLEVYVYDQPDFNVSDATVNLCDGDGPQNVVISVVDNYLANSQLKLKIDIEVDSVDAAITQQAIHRSNMDTIIIGVTGPDGDGTDENITVLANYPMSAINGGITRYRFAFGAGLEANDNGITDHISRKSDYLTNSAAVDANWTYYAGSTSGTLTWIVYPAPNTGQIYYIPDTFDQ